MTRIFVKRIAARWQDRARNYNVMSCIALGMRPGADVGALVARQHENQHNPTSEASTILPTG